MLDDLAAAGAWVDGWEAKLAERAATARALSIRLAALTATARDRAGLISVTVGSSGSMIDLALDERCRQQSAAETARQILVAARAAQAQLMDQIRAASHEAYGDHSATAESIIESYRQRLHPDGPDAAR
jgi:DNA-binding protein YbaB